MFVFFFKCVPANPKKFRWSDLFKTGQISFFKFSQEICLVFQMKLSKNTKWNKLAWKRSYSHSCEQNKKTINTNEYLTKRERREKLFISSIDLKIRANKKTILKENDQKSSDPLLMIQLQSFIENMKKNLNQFDEESNTFPLFFKTRVWKVLSTVFKQLEEEKKNSRIKNFLKNLGEVKTRINQKKSNVFSNDYFREVFSNFEHSSLPLDFDYTNNLLDFSKTRFNQNKLTLSPSSSIYSISFSDNIFPPWENNLENFKNTQTKIKKINTRIYTRPLFYNFSISEYGNFFGHKKKKKHQTEIRYSNMNLLWGEIF